MIIIKRLFADNILRYKERTGHFVEVVKRIPGLGKVIDNQVTDKNNKVLKNFFGIIAWAFAFAWIFVKKLLFVLLFVWLPCELISRECPLVAEQKELTLIFLFLVICTLCGSISNNVVSVVERRDYLMTRIMLVSPSVNYIGKLMYKILTDMVLFSVALFVIRVSFPGCIVLGVATACARPVGELFTVLMYEKSKLLYNNRGAVYGAVMAISLLAGYGSLLLTRTVSSFWWITVNPVFAVVLFVLGVIAFLILCNYRNYAGIVNCAITMKESYED